MSDNKAKDGSSASASCSSDMPSTTAHTHTVHFLLPSDDGNYVLAETGPENEARLTRASIPIENNKFFSLIPLQRKVQEVFPFPVYFANRSYRCMEDDIDNPGRDVYQDMWIVHPAGDFPAVQEPLKWIHRDDVSSYRWVNAIRSFRPGHTARNINELFEDCTWKEDERAKPWEALGFYKKLMSWAIGVLKKRSMVMEGRIGFLQDGTDGRIFTCGVRVRDGGHAVDAIHGIGSSEANVTFINTTAQRQVIAYGANEELSAVFNPRLVRWSDIENPDEWNATPQNNAGENTIDDGGNLVSAIDLENGSFVWTDSGLHFQQFIGAEGQTFQFSKVGSNCGLAGPHAAAVIGQQAFWVSPDLRFWTASLGGEATRLISPLARDFGTNVNATQVEKIHAASLTEFNEIWFHYPDQRDGVENSRYVAFNIVDGTWFEGDIARTAFEDAGPAPFVVGVDFEGHFYWHERGNTANGSPLNSLCETGDVYIGSAQNVIQVRDYWPDFDDQKGTVSFSVISRLFPQAPEVTHGPFSLDIGREKLSFRCSGQILRFKWEGASTNNFFRLGSPIFDVVTRGRK